MSASLASGGVTAAYDSTYGSMTGISSSGSAGYSLRLAVDPVLSLPIGQNVANLASGATLLTAAIDYDANGLRASRTVSAGSDGSGSSTTEYWYGGNLHPLVIDRDGVTSRMIGKSVIEQMAAGNPTNFGDDNGAMLEESADDSERIEQLLDQLLQDPQTKFEVRDRNLLRLRLSTVERGVQNLVSRSEALMHRITDIRAQAQQTEAALQTAREQQVSYHAINLFSQHIREGRVQRIRQGERNQYIAVVRHTAEDLSNRRMSASERRLSDRYFQLLRSEDSLQGELQMVDAEQRDLEGWLDIYQVVIERMWDPDETPSEAEDDDEDYEDIDIRSGDSSASESDDDAGSAGRRIEPTEHGGGEQRRANSRNADGQDDEKAE
jgi:hypothetical protein